MGSNLIISTSGEPFTKIKNFLTNTTREILLIAPYIKTDVLKRIIPDKELSITIITSWKIRDLLFGSSDLSLYQFAKERSLNLFIHNRIHLKAYISDWKSIICGSANLTNSGLGISTNYNYELNSIIPSIDLQTHVYLKTILFEATLVTDDTYNTISATVKNHLPVLKVEEIDIQTPVLKTDEFLISSLPMSEDAETLFSIYTNNDYELIESDKNECALHDIVLYQIPFNLNKHEFFEKLKESFFESKFIKKLLSYIDDEERYFGQIKEWIQQNCQDVPVPSRRDLTGNIQVLFKWIVELSDGRYLVDRPNYSQRIYRVSR